MNPKTTHYFFTVPRERPLLTEVSRPFWHGHGTAMAIHAWASVQGGIRQDILCPAAALRQRF
jgi:hypothetical protein